MTNDEVIPFPKQEPPKREWEARWVALKNIVEQDYKKRDQDGMSHAFLRAVLGQILDTMDSLEQTDTVEEKND